MNGRFVPHSRLCLRDLAAPGTNVRSGEAAPQRQSETDWQLWAVQIQLGGEDDRGEWTLLRRPSGTPSDGYTDLGT